MGEAYDQPMRYGAAPVSVRPLAFQQLRNGAVDPSGAGLVCLGFLDPAHLFPAVADCEVIESLTRIVCLGKGSQEISRDGDLARCRVEADVDPRLHPRPPRRPLVLGTERGSAMLRSNRRSRAVARVKRTYRISHGASST
jgi:hypothetical protein